MRGFLRAALVLLVALGIGCGAARAASVPLVNPQQLQIPSIGGDLNTIINSINVILSPLTGAGAITGSTPGVSTTAVNVIALVPAITGTTAMIGLQAGGDTNAAITINPNGSGNIIMFGTGDTGVIQIGNSTGWYPAKGAGVVPCPGGGAAPANLAGGLLLQGGAQTVAGYEVHEDWVGRPYWIPGCR